MRNPATPGFEPAYLALHRRGELEQRAAEAVARLGQCTLCPRQCGADRLSGKTGTCRTGRYARLASYFPHHGEEAPLRGWRGSGTLFFAQCSLRCVFCQNYDISQEGWFPETSPAQLAAAMLHLQALGCHNINFVTPTHVVPQILEALVLAVEGGLRLPLVYNCSGYEAVESLRLLEGVVDIYMPDFKLWDEQASARYLHARDYPAVARAALLEMQRQVGTLSLDEQGLARRGVLVRHLVMPDNLAGTACVGAFLADQLSPETYLNVMGQYHPAGQVTHSTFPELARPVTAAEMAAARNAARQAGLHRLD